MEGIIDAFHNLFSLMYDPVLRGPFFTCVFMGMFGGLLGIWLFFQKQLLIGEVLSHSIFPGMILGAVVFPFLGISKVVSVDFELLGIFIGGAISAYTAILFMRFLVVNKLATQDSALSFTLSTTFGVGLLAISILQREYPSLWRKLTSFLMGQAATIPNHFILISCAFLCFVLASFLLYKRSFFSYLFDRQFALLHGLMSSRIEHVTIIAVIVASILGVRLMGVVLMSAMLTFPPVTARFFSDRARTVAWCSILFGGITCGFGVLLSHIFSTLIRTESGKPLWLPTGPIVVLLMSALFLVSMLFAPKHGIFMKLIRRGMFQWRCTQENLVKFLWKTCVALDAEYIPWEQIVQHSPLLPSSFSGRLHYIALSWGGYITRTERGGGVYVTAKSLIEGRKLVRLHRLWELYLVEHCGMDRASVHPSAEEMEHIITPEMEEELMTLLNDPDIDPHQQPIPVAVEKILLVDRCCSHDSKTLEEEIEKEGSTKL